MDFDHDLVVVDEFDALSVVDLRDVAVAAATPPSVSLSAALPSAVSEKEGGWHQLAKEAPKLGKYPALDHARKVAKELGVVSGLIYLPGQETILMEDSDQALEFRQRRYFYYITGIDLPNCAATYDIGHDNLTLWIPRVEPRQALYFGSGPDPAACRARSDLSDVRHMAELARYLRKYVSTSSPPPWERSFPTTTSAKATIYLLHPDQTPPLDLVRATGSICLDATRLQPAMDAARVVKSPWEIAAIRRANAVSSAAHRAVLSRLREMTNEREVEALFRGYCLAVGAKRQAYPVIAGSGANAATLHYDANDRALAGKQFVVLDAGCEWECYASDITRTMPLSGTLSPEAREVYALVEKMQEGCIAAVRPGVAYFQLHLHALGVATAGLLELGILKGGSVGEILAKGTAAAFFPHGLGHHVGLEVHDVSGRERLMLPMGGGGSAVKRGKGAIGKREWVSPEMVSLMVRAGREAAPCRERQRLVEGMVVSIEPGIYFCREYIEPFFLSNPAHAEYIDKDVLEKYYDVGGVRIEDNILVTENGYENLTTAPKGEQMLNIINGEGV